MSPIHVELPIHASQPTQQVPGTAMLIFRTIVGEQKAHKVPVLPHNDGHFRHHGASISLWCQPAHSRQRAPSSSTPNPPTPTKASNTRNKHTAVTAASRCTTFERRLQIPRHPSAHIQLPPDSYPNLLCAHIWHSCVRRITIRRTCPITPSYDSFDASRQRRQSLSPRPSASPKIFDAAVRGYPPETAVFLQISAGCARFARTIHQISAKTPHFQTVDSHSDSFGRSTQIHFQFCHP